MNKADAAPITPFVDLATPHAALEEELVGVFREALRSASFIGGPAVESFERNFAAFCGSAHCAGVASGTDALRLALIAAGVRPGDTVVTVANTFMATVEAITQAGATPAFVDIDESTFNISAPLLEEHLDGRCRRAPDGALIDKRTGGRVTAIAPVHLYGQPCDMDEVLRIAHSRGLAVVEDACQAHGAEYYSAGAGSWLRAGSMGTAAAFSFYPGKNLGACGDAGAVTTGDEAIACSVRAMRDHGQSKRYYHEIEGWNSRLDSIQAGFLDVKLRLLSGWNAMRVERARAYGELLEGIDEVTAPAVMPWARHVYHLYVIRTKDRDGLQKRLSENGVATALHYPVPIHMQSACRRLGYERGDLPATEAAATEILSLPMYPGLTAEQQARTAELVRGYY